MKLVSMGDMAQSLALRRQNMTLNAELLRLTQELATGETISPARHLAGDYRYLSDIEHRSRTAYAYQIATREAGGFASAMQSALETIQNGTESLAADLATASSGTQETRTVLAMNAQEQLDMMVSALNTSYAGRSLFAGDQTGQAALASADDMLAAIRPMISGMVSAADIRQAVSDWFASDTGFGSNGYLGSTDHLAPFRLGEGDSVQLNLRADAQELRMLMSDLAIAALSQDFAGQGIQESLLERAGLGLLENQDHLTALRADLGFAEARIEEIGVGLAAERLSLDHARDALLGVDEFETATELETVQFHLEALYTVTARLSGLTLVNYL